MNAKRQRGFIPLAVMAALGATVVLAPLDAKAGIGKQLQQARSFVGKALIGAARRVEPPSRHREFITAGPPQFDRRTGMFSRPTGHFVDQALRAPVQRFVMHPARRVAAGVLGILGVAIEHGPAEVAGRLPTIGLETSSLSAVLSPVGPLVTVVRKPAAQRQ